MHSLLPPYGTDDATDAAMRDEKGEIESESAAITQSIQGISLSVSKRLGFEVLKLTLERLGDLNVMLIGMLGWVVVGGGPGGIWSEGMVHIVGGVGI
jgi:hypothetical protein